MEKKLCLCIFGGFNRKLIFKFDILVYGSSKEKIVWFGKVLIMQSAVFGCCCVTDWTVLPLKILN